MTSHLYDQGSYGNNASIITTNVTSSLITAAASEIGSSPSPTFPPSSYIQNEEAHILDDDYTSIWSKIAALLWIGTLIFWLYAHGQQEEEQERYMEEQRSLDMERKKRNNMLEPEKRTIVINDTIISMNIEEDQLHGLENSAPVHSSGSSSSSEQHPAECPICLDRFEPGNELSWSKELKCHHIFHTDCLKPWLMTNDECPCCRTLLFDEKDFEKRGFLLIGNDNRKQRQHVVTGSMDESEGGNQVNISSSGRHQRFRIVNGLISVVRQLSGSESSRGLGFGSSSSRDSLSFSERRGRRGDGGSSSSNSHLSRFRARDGLSRSEFSNRRTAFAEYRRDELSQSEGIGSGRRHTVSTLFALADHNDLAETQQLGDACNKSLEMVSITQKSKSDTSPYTSVTMNDLEMGIGTNITTGTNGSVLLDQYNRTKKKKKNRHKDKKRYSALTNKYSDDDNNQSCGNKPTDNVSTSNLQSDNLKNLDEEEDEVIV